MVREFAFAAAVLASLTADAHTMVTGWAYPPGVLQGQRARRRL